MEPRIRKELGLDDPPPSDKPWEVVLLWAMRFWPTVAILLVGSGLTWLNVVFGHHLLWRSLLYGFGLPLVMLVVALFFGLKDFELGCGCLLAVILVGLFLVMLIQGKEKIERRHATHAVTPRPPRR